MTDRISTDELRKLLGEATPGEWKWTLYSGGGEPVGSLVSEGGRTVLDLGDETTYYPTAGTAPEDSDARLISLAPDLAAEVIRLREALVRIEQHYTDTDLAAKHMAATARAALNHKGII